MSIRLTCTRIIEDKTKHRRNSCYTISNVISTNHWATISWGKKSSLRIILFFNTKQEIRITEMFFWKSKDLSNLLTCDSSACRFEAESQEPLPFPQAGHVDESDSRPSSAKWRRRGPRPPLTRRLQRPLFIRRKSKGRSCYLSTNTNQYNLTVAHNISRQFQSTYGGFFQKVWRSEVRWTRSVQ